jgi:hypothetical protein
MTVSVGQGIRDRMTASNDHPLEDSTFKANGDGSVVEKCLGTLGMYVASNASGQWESLGPLPLVEAV